MTGVVPTGFMPSSLQDHVDSLIRAAAAPQGFGFERAPVYRDERGQLRNSPNAYFTRGGQNVGFNMFAPGGATGGGWGGSGGGTDWGGIIGTLGSQITGIYAQKHQNRALRRMARLGGGVQMPRTYNMGGGGGGYYTPQGFVPQFANTVPAAAGAGSGGIPWLLGAAGGVAAGLLPGLTDMLPGGLEEAGTGLFGPDLFRPTNAGQRQNMLDAVNPATGVRQFWRPVGTPLVFTGDAALLKRTRKMVRKLSSVAGCGVAGRFRRRRR